MKVEYRAAWESTDYEAKCHNRMICHHCGLDPGVFLNRVYNVQMNPLSLKVKKIQKQKEQESLSLMMTLGLGLCMKCA